MSFLAYTFQDQAWRLLKGVNITNTDYPMSLDNESKQTMRVRVTTPCEKPNHTTIYTNVSVVLYTVLSIICGQ